MNKINLNEDNLKERKGIQVDKREVMTKVLEITDVKKDTHS